jgi:fructose-1,6-bisphosphatase/inositol monophosphatase family enzyme
MLLSSSGPTPRASYGKRVIETTSEVDLAVERSVRDFLHNKTPEVDFLGGWCLVSDSSVSG